MATAAQQQQKRDSYYEGQNASATCAVCGCSSPGTRGIAIQSACIVCQSRKADADKPGAKGDPDAKKASTKAPPPPKKKDDGDGDADDGDDSDDDDDTETEAATGIYGQVNAPVKCRAGAAAGSEFLE